MFFCLLGPRSWLVLCFAFFPAFVPGSPYFSFRLSLLAGGSAICLVAVVALVPCTNFCLGLSDSSWYLTGLELSSVSNILAGLPCWGESDAGLLSPSCSAALSCFSVSSWVFSGLGISDLSGGRLICFSVCFGRLVTEAGSSCGSSSGVDLVSLTAVLSGFPSYSWVFAWQGLFWRAGFCLIGLQGWSTCFGTLGPVWDNFPLSWVWLTCFGYTGLALDTLLFPLHFELVFSRFILNHEFSFVWGGVLKNLPLPELSPTTQLRGNPDKMICSTIMIWYMVYYF